MRSEQLEGFKYFKVLSGMLQTLHDAACTRDRALHMDQYVTLLLMYMFNPVCSSLRAVQKGSAGSEGRQVFYGKPLGGRTRL